MWWILLVLAIVCIFYAYRQFEKYERRMTLRRLWADHNVYTRLHLVAKNAGDPIAQDYLDRLLRNADGLDTAAGTGNMVRLYTTRLLQVASDIFAKKDASASIARSYKDTEDTVRLAHGEALDAAFKAHLDKVISQIQLLVNKGNDFKKDVAAFDASNDLAMNIADMLA
jgi:hypothetical protein